MALAARDMNIIDVGDDEEIVSTKKSNNSKRMSVERIYQKKTQLEHILLRPDSYIGSVEPCEQDMWIYDSENDTIISKKITYTPGLYKIFDEILVNAADNKQRDPRMNLIKINIDVEKNVISVWNNGKGIPVEMHKTEKMFVPTMIFGHLLTSSNYDDTDKKVVGGRNGFGAKLCNIFSTKFTVETAANGKKFKQVWRKNMGKAEEEKVVDFSGTDYTCITYSPDLPKFKMEKLDDDFVALLKRRAYDIAGVSRGVSVQLNGTKLKVKTFKDFVQLHLKGVALAKQGLSDDGRPDQKIVHEIVNPRWEVCVTVSETGFQQCSFVNSIATTKGGTHINYLVDQIIEKIIVAVKKKQGKGGFNIRPFQVKSHLWVFVNTLIENPTFDSQTKENMTLRKSSFGSVCELSEKYIKQVQECGVLENIMSWVKFKSEAQLNKKTYANKHSKLKGIPKLDDANDAGTKNSRNCTLIITEGDSAKALAMSGLGVIGRDKYGVFPLKGKMLNVRDATHKQIMDNAEVGFLLKIIGLQFGKKYTEEDMKTLRYGHLMIMADQDVDGSHIKGLVINFIHASWPSLLKLPFLEEFITPIVKVTKGNESHSFYSVPELDEWREQTPNHKSYRVKYYKGLGTSTSKEGKEYFSNMQRHRIVFEYDGPSSDQALILAFSKKCANERKAWLTQMMEETKLRKEAGLPAVYLYEKDTKSVSYRDFVNKELILFSNADNERSIPSLVDGLKPGQRKVLFTVMKRNDKNEVKVAQLAGAVGEMSAYHHGEASLMGTIVNLAQNFVGSNNLNLLEPHGQFGTRNLGGKDSASPRYIFTKMSPLTRLIFPAHDDNVLNFLTEDNMKIEPEWYCPIIPMALINGAEGIGTGYSTKIPNYDIRELVAMVKTLISGEELMDEEIKPSYKNFKGDIEKTDTQRYQSYGIISVIDDTTLEISELPVRCWTQSYKDSVMDILLYGNEKVQPMITDYKEYHTDTSVKFIITMTAQQLAKAEQEGLHKIFKLDGSFSTSSMVLFDEYGCIRKYESVHDIVKEYYAVRLQVFKKRRIFLIGMLEAECSKLENQARFILEKIDGKIIIENRAKRDIITTLVERGYLSDPVKSWKLSIDVDDADTNDGESIFDAGSSVSGASSGGPDFQYLLTMHIMAMSKEKKEELLKQRDEKNLELEVLRGKTPESIWLDELDVFSEELDRCEEQERLDEKASGSLKKAPSKSRKGVVAKAVKKVVVPVKPEVKPVKPVKPKKAAKAKEESSKRKESPSKRKESPSKEKEEQSEKTNGEVLSLADRLKKNAGGAKKQTTLTFKKKPKRKFGSSSESDSEDDFNPNKERKEDFAPAAERTMRQKTEKKYIVDDDDGDDEDDFIVDKTSESEQSDKDVGMDEDKNGSDDQDSGKLELPGGGVKRKGVFDFDGNNAEAETRALIEKLSPMKKKPNTDTSKAKPVSKLTLDSESVGSSKSPISIGDSPPKKEKTTKKPVSKQSKISFDKKDSSQSDEDEKALFSEDDDDDVQEALPKKTAPKKAAPKKASPKKTPPKEDSSDNVSVKSSDNADSDSDYDIKKAEPKKAAPKKAAPKKAAPKKASPKKTPPKEDSSDNVSVKSSDNADSDSDYEVKKAEPKKAAPKKAAPKKAAPKKAAPKKQAPKKAEAKKNNSDDEASHSDEDKEEEPSKTTAVKRTKSKSSDDDSPKKKKVNTKKTSPKKPPAKKSRKKFCDSDSDDNSDDDYNMSKEGNEAGSPPPPLRERVGRATVQTTKKKYKFSSSEDEDSDDFC